MNFTKQNTDEKKSKRLKIILTKKLIKKNYVLKKLSKYVPTFDCLDKVLIVLGATNGGVCIISSVTTGIIKNHWA